LDILELIKDFFEGDPPKVEYWLLPALPPLLKDFQTLSFQCSTDFPIPSSHFDISRAICYVPILSISFDRSRWLQVSSSWQTSRFAV